MAIQTDDTKGVASGAMGMDRWFTWTLPIVGQGMAKTPQDIGSEAMRRKAYWSDRNAAMERYDDLLVMVDDNKEKGLESMVANNAKTLFALSHFMVSSSIPQRTVAIGDQGPQARRRAGKAERAVYAWWQCINESRLHSGLETWQYEMAYWMCLYGWYATLALTTLGDEGKPEFLAVPYDPSECYPEYGAPELGLKSFARVYDSTLGEVMDKAKLYGTYTEGAYRGDPLSAITVVDWWQRWSDGGTPVVVNALVANGLTGTGGFGWVKELEEMKGLKRIPVMVGPVGGTPSRSHRKDWMAYPGSVLAENERIYKDFNKWMSFLTQLVKEHARAPILARNMHLEQADFNPADLRQEAHVIETDDPEAEISRVNVGAVPMDVFRLLGMFTSLEQRGGFPEAAYGSLMVQLSGFGISQLLQAAERRVGAQVQKLMFVDASISGRWLRDFRDNAFAPITIEGFEGGNPRKSFIEDMRVQDVPKKFRLSTNIPIRMGNDLMARMSVVRQALPGNEQILDLYTALDEILEMQDPTLVIDRIAEDSSRRMSEPLRMAMNLKLQASDLRASRKPGADQAAQMLEMFAETLLQQQQQAMGPQQRPRVSPEAQPPEARGVSPDQVRAGLRMGPPPNLTREEQLT